MEAEVNALLAKLRARGFWGKFTICMKNGEIYGYVQEETFKPKNGEKNERRNDYSKD